MAGASGASASRSEHPCHAVLCRAAPRTPPGPALCCAVPCCAPQDLVIPALKPPGHYQSSPLLLAPPQKRDILLYFKGDMGRHRMPWYSRCGGRGRGWGGRPVSGRGMA